MSPPEEDVCSALFSPLLLLLFLTPLSYTVPHSCTVDEIEVFYLFIYLTDPYACRLFTPIRKEHDAFTP